MYLYFYLAYYLHCYLEREACKDFRMGFIDLESVYDRDYRLRREIMGWVQIRLRICTTLVVTGMRTNGSIIHIHLFLLHTTFILIQKEKVVMIFVRVLLIKRVYDRGLQTVQTDYGVGLDKIKDMYNIVVTSVRTNGLIILKDVYIVEGVIYRIRVDEVEKFFGCIV